MWGVAVSMLKQLLLNHMISSETEERDGPSEGSKPTGAPGSPQPESPEVTSVWDQSSESAKQQPQHVPSEQAEPSDQHNGEDNTIQYMPFTCPNQLLIARCYF